ncbi:YodC family protein, partial [Acinetobacter baumannii]|uniref:YodC family protein n=1 Tax=Acinetobacter baumannii TaxID=470 RepID=UPI0034D39AC9
MTAYVLSLSSINPKGPSMELKTGDVVMLKSGGQPLTVAEVKGDDVVCLWMGSEGDLFRETLPLATL